MRTLAMPKAAEPWSLTSLGEKLIKIGAKVVSHGRYVTFQMAEVAVSRQMFAEILSLIARLRAPPAPAWRGFRGRKALIKTGEVRLDEGKQANSSPPDRQSSAFATEGIIMGDACCGGGPKVRPWPSSAPKSGECGFMALVLGFGVFAVRKTMGACDGCWLGLPKREPSSAAAEGS
jgi:hypothetical protein